MRILFLSRWYPYPADNGSKLRVLALLKSLSRCHSVSLLSFSDGDGAATHEEKLLTFCESVWSTPWISYSSTSLRAAAGLFSRSPRYLVDTYSVKMADAINRAVRTFKPDVIVASQIDMSVYRNRFHQVPALLDEVEVGSHFDRWISAEGMLNRARHRLSWAKLTRYLARLSDSFHACTVVSQRERELLEAHGIAPEWIEVVPNFVELPEYRGYGNRRRSRRPTLVFTGSLDYEPNYQAMIWFLRACFPKIRAEVPGVKLLITGKHRNRPLPSEEGVECTGYVEDVKAVIASAHASIAPILTGGGTRLKILEALAIGTPVVTTAKGAEGLEVESGRQIFIADDPVKFAEYVVMLLGDPVLRESLSRAGRALIKRSYDRTAVFPRFAKAIERVIAQSTSGRPGSPARISSE